MTDNIINFAGQRFARNFKASLAERHKAREQLELLVGQFGLGLLLVEMIRMVALLGHHLEIPIEEMVEQLRGEHWGFGSHKEEEGD